jgi:plastocyanin
MPTTNTEFKMSSAQSVIVALIPAMLVACSGGYSPTTSPVLPDPRTVAATPSLAFGPASLTIGVGDTVTFAFGSVAHNVFFDAETGAPADIGGLNANVSVRRSFLTPGTYHYTCHIHPSMHGTIVVDE